MFKPTKLLGEVMTLTYLVNQNSDYCTMIRYAGHVDLLKIQIFPDKEHCIEDEPIYESEFYVDGKHGCDPEKELRELKAALEHCLFPCEDLEMQQESTRP